MARPRFKWQKQKQPYHTEVFPVCVECHTLVIGLECPFCGRRPSRCVVVTSPTSSSSKSAPLITLC